MNRLMWILLIVCMSSGCWYRHIPVPPIFPVRGDVAVYSETPLYMIVSEGYVYAAYMRWTKHLNRKECQQRLYDLCVATNMDGTWTIRKSALWDE